MGAGGCETAEGRGSLAGSRFWYSLNWLRRDERTTPGASRDPRLEGVDASADGDRTTTANTHRILIAATLQSYLPGTAFGLLLTFHAEHGPLRAR